MKKALPSPEILRKLLRYDPETGQLFWRKRPREMFATGMACVTWNGRYAGRRALAYRNGNGYFQGTIFNKKYKAHRVCYALHHGHWPSYQIDHIDGNRTNNKISNLRDVTSQENQRNLTMQSNNTSGATGVYWHKADKKWCAQIMVDCKRINLGCFTIKDDAIAARKSAEIMHGFHENHGKSRQKYPRRG